MLMRTIGDVLNDDRGLGVACTLLVGSNPGKFKHIPDHLFGHEARVCIIPTIRQIDRLFGINAIYSNGCTTVARAYK